VSRGDVVVSFTIAVSEGTKDNPESGFYEVSAWKMLGQNVMDSLTKGQRVVVTGVLRTGKWTTKEGQTRSKMSITADAVGPDLRFATAHVTANTRPSVAPVQQQYMTDEEWAAERAKGTAAASEEPF
jgi:single-strand DNA-binding protein